MPIITQSRIKTNANNCLEFIHYYATIRHLQGQAIEINP